MTLRCQPHHIYLFLSLSHLLTPYAAFKSGADLIGGVERVIGTARLTGCLFPEKWEGTWFQSGVRQPITIEGPRLSNKGTCLGAEGDKFLVVDDKRVCYRCVVIHEKHANVLQYKETFCHGRDSLPTLCSLITGDALLYSMFREGALPVPCPFRGPFTFTYNRGHGECRNPVSSIDVCTEDSRLLLSYQACPDVYGTESTVEELECLATWKEGSSRYLVGKVHHSHATSNEDRFRCFVYEKTTPGPQGQGGGLTHRDRERNLLQQGLIHPGHEDVDYRVAQSGDATCNGLFSATEGSRTMTLRRAPSPNKCRFPSWLSSSQHWHTLDYSATYSFHHRNSTLRITNSTSGQEMKVVCAQLRHHTTDSAPVMLVAHFTMGCQSGYLCMLLYRRDTHVVEVQIGSYVRRPEDACTNVHFNKTSSFVTLVSTSPESRSCPYTGKFSITSSPVTSRSLRKRDWMRWRHVFEHQTLNRSRRVDRSTAPCNDDRLTTMVVGCSSHDTMEFYGDCDNMDIISAYSCHGSWEENGTHYLITTPLSRSSHGARRQCFMYRETVVDRAEDRKARDPEEETSHAVVIHFSSSSEGCDRNVRPGREGVVVFNATSTGKCIETNNNPRTELSISVLLVTLLPIFINYLLFQTHR